MAWTTPGTAVAGEVYTAAFYNEQTRDNLNYLKTEADAVGLVHLDTITLTTTATGALEGVFSAAYDNYLVIYNITTSSTATDLYGQMLNGSTPVTSTSYTYAGYSSGATLTNLRSTSNSVMDLGGASTGSGEVIIQITSPFLAQRTRLAFFGASNATIVKSGVAEVATTTSYDGMRIYPSAGTYTGTARVYGYRNS